MIFLEIVLKDYKVQDKNILITYIDQNYQENLEYDFLSTLRNVANILKSLGRDYDTVLVTDCGDIWYQDSIDVIFNQAAGGHNIIQKPHIFCDMMGAL